MKIKCKNHAYNIITGEKIFTRGAIYSTNLTEDSIEALDDKGEWTAVSAKVGTLNLFENDVFTFHFEVIESQIKLKVI